MVPCNHCGLVLDLSACTVDTSVLIVSSSGIKGHMEKQEMERKRKLEMEIGNGNEKHTYRWCNVFFIVCLVILLSNGYMTGFMSRVLYLYSCAVLCDYCF